MPNITITYAPKSPNNFAVNSTEFFNELSFNGLSIANPLVRQYGVGTAAPGANGYADLTGTDTVTGFSQPRFPHSPWGGTAPVIDTMQVIADNVGDQPRSIINTVGPSGTLENVLQMIFSAAYDGNCGGQNGATMQNAEIIYPDQSVTQGMTYQSMWVWFQADMGPRLKTFMELNESKTGGTERHTMGLVNTSYSFGVPCWYMIHDRAGAGNPYIDYHFVAMSPNLSVAPLQSGQTYVAPVVYGQWFRLEWAHKFVYGQTGWVWMALTIPESTDPLLRAGVQVFYESGANWNPAANALMNRLFWFSAYSDMTRSPSNPCTIRIARPQFAIAWPSTATAHPNVS